MRQEGHSMNWNCYCMIICITLLKFSQCELSIYAYNYWALVDKCEDKINVM